jgi:hypothetical protein
MNLLSTSAETASTPQYVLLNGKTRIAPTILALQSGRNCLALYGFSDKAPYDLFRQASELALTPFPLVKVYLRTLLETNSNDLHLVILDASGPADERLRAATMQSVLDAQLAQTASVPAQYSLRFDAPSNSYRVDE